MNLPDPPPKLERPRLLFADSSRLMRRAAERILGSEFSITLAEDLEQAWIALQEDALIQLVFCDLTGRDGQPELTLIENIRTAGSRRVRETPVVMMIDDDPDNARNDTLRDQALKLGVTDFITKPFRPSELIARARTHASIGESIQRLSALEKQHNKDAETGLGNRRYFFERLAQALSFAKRHQQALSLVHVHLDGLAEVCERHEDDQMQGRLAKLGRVLARAVRHEDTVYRTGPETFSFVLPGTDAEGAEIVRCRLAPELDGMGLLDGSSMNVKSRFVVQSPPLDPEEPLVVSLRQIREGMGGLPFRHAIKTPPATSPPAATSELDELIELARRGDQQALKERLPEMLSRLRPLLELAGELEQLKDRSPEPNKPN